SEPGISTASDCDPPLHLWLRDGPDGARHLRATNAVAVYERAVRRVSESFAPNWGFMVPIGA
ncbi:MAG TPA: hypothetical protein VHY76_12715, partial [Acetobacteraceae bacterium]|nr:hypothetical protein [Acetobacteraceae bacterium]